jgi:hypothetical protein
MLCVAARLEAPLCPACIKAVVFVQAALVVLQSSACCARTHRRF